MRAERKRWSWIARSALLVLALPTAISIACDPVIVIGRVVVGAVDAGSDAPTSPGEDASSGDGGLGEGGAPADGGDGDPDAGDGGEAAYPPEILWFADHEDQTLDAWEEDGGVYSTGVGDAPSVTPSHAKSGGHSIAFTIDTSSNTTQTSRVYHRTLAGPAYYSVWFYLADDATPAEWWSIDVFRGLHDPNDLTTAVDLWDINLERNQAGDLVFTFFEHQTSQKTYAEEIPVRVRGWFQLECLLDPGASEGVRLACWYNDDLVLDVGGLVPSPAEAVFWVIGSGSNGLDPDVVTMYADDAAVTRERLGTPYEPEF